MRYYILLLLCYCNPIFAELVILSESIEIKETSRRFSSVSSTSTLGMSIDGGRVFDNKTLQTFTAERSGTLDLACFKMQRRISPAPNPRVRIVLFSNGVITSVLGTAFIDGESLPERTSSSRQNQRLNCFADFRSSSVFLTKGEEYAIVIDTEDLDANYGITGSSFIDDGGRWSSQNSNVFRERKGRIYYQLVSGYDPSTTDLKLKIEASLEDNAGTSTNFIRRVFFRLRWDCVLGRTYEVQRYFANGLWFTVNTYSAESTLGIFDSSEIPARPQLYRVIEQGAAPNP